MLRRAVCLLLLLIASSGLGAQPAPYVGERQPRILLLVDASSSMLQSWSQQATRFQTAGSIITTLMDSIYAVNEGVEFGLRVYGNQSPAQNNDCYDSRQEVMFSKNNLTQMSLRMASIKPYGVSPIAYSLQEAAINDLIDDARNAYSIILITDGGESCGGNICDVVKQLIERKIYFKPYIVSLVDYAPLRQQYECLGTYLQAAKPGDIPIAVKTIVDAYRPLLSAPIMAVKADPVRPKTDSQVIAIPRWIPEHSSMSDIRIVVPEPRPSTSTYRPVLQSLPQPNTIAVSKPPAEPPPVPAWKPEHSVMPQLAVMWSGAFPIPAGSYRPQMRVMAYSPVFAVSKPAPEVPAWKPGHSTIPAIAAAQPQSFQVGAYRPLLYRMALPPTIAVSKPPAEAPTVPKRDTLMVLRAQLRRNELSIARLSDVTPSPNTTVVALPKIQATKRDTIIAVIPPTAPKADPPPLRSDPPARTTVSIKKIEVTIKPTIKPTGTVTPNKPKETVFIKETEDAKETSLAILFTDGRGKFYATSPQLQLLDAKTGKLVKQFYRTVDANGNPDLQTVPAGTYNLLVAGQANMLMRGVTIEPNKKNKITVRVNNGSLRFRYVDNDDNPIDRPITEFEAIVNIRFEPGPTIRQRCTAELEYAPGNYYIEVKTTPISRYNVDIDFGAITEIRLQQPGFVQFTNTRAKGNISLFAPLGNRFVRFADVNVTGSPAAQRLMLKPGAYEAHWVKNPNVPYATETIEHFNVQSNSITEIELQ